MCNTFPYKYQVIENREVEHVDGWKNECDIEKEVLRQGIQLSESTSLRLYSNEGFKLCASYPSKWVVPAAMSDEDL